MKRLLLVVFLDIALSSFSQNGPKPDTLWVEEEMVYQPVHLDELPVFPGGPDEMVKWIEKELLFPTQDDIQGKCYVKMTLLSSGKIAQPTVVRGIPGCPECDKEAIRLVKKMPLWIPGILNGKPVACEMYIPVSFNR